RDSGLVTYSLGSQVVDRAEPREALRATVARGVGLENAQVLVSVEQLARFRRGQRLNEEPLIRGKRGAYFQVARLELEARGRQEWKTVFDVERTQADIVQLLAELRHPETASRAVDEDVRKGTLGLKRIVAKTDGLQVSADEATVTHHLA